MTWRLTPRTPDLLVLDSSLTHHVVSLDIAVIKGRNP